MRRRRVAVVLIAVFLVAFAVRLLWAETVQSPFDSIYSDMQGYVSRADDLLAGRIPGDPRILSIYPPGTHTIIAGEFWLFGRNSRHAIAVVHALVDALPATLAAAITLQLVSSVGAAAVAGLAVALWYPHACFVGFFSSEVWFAALVTLQAWLAGRQWSRTRSMLLVGAASAASFVVRPQFLLTWGLQMLPYGLRFLLGPERKGVLLRIVCLTLPLAIMISLTATRFHRLTGRWGLIAQSAGTRLWADTDVCKIESHWRTADGGEYSWWFSPPSKPALKPSDSVSFEGFIVDPDILDRIRLERLRGVPLRDRLARKINNVKLLLVNNLPWPENNYHEDVSILLRTEGVPRFRLLEAFRDILLYAGIPLCFVGLALGRKNRAMYVVASNLVTIVVTAAFFFGEARYLVPYVPFILVMAVVGCHALYGEGRKAVLRVLRRVRSARWAARPAPQS
jgi:hypothetical protein